MREAVNAEESMRVPVVCLGLSGFLVLVSFSAWGGAWCTTASYSAALSSGLNRTFGAGTHGGTQGQQCFASQMACESARQTASYGVSTTPCAQQGGPSGAPGTWTPESAESPMSSENYRPDFEPKNKSSETSPALVDAQEIELTYPWEPPPTCMARFPEMSNRYDQLLARRNKDQRRFDIYVVDCSGIEADSIVEAECNKEKEAMRPEINSYREAVRTQNGTDRVSCEKYVAQIGTNKDSERRWHSGLACAVTDIYARTRSLGEVGAQFASQLRQDVKDAQFTSPLAQDPEAVAVSNVSESQMFSWHKNTQAASQNLSQQITVDVLVSHHIGDGSVVIQAVSALLDESNQRDNEQTTLLIYDKAGHLVGGNYSPSVRHCLASAVR